ncbi:CYTH domain-containing protein [Halomonas saccharevitans]|uniref:CYTH domain-containing protein n=1 Tax=Halomonas saccharevitans TaxID=416872 RepID=A0ABU3NFX5_9GAMM|nr:CYTH domain-containing protein [Halomonas saccharevitans]MDT8880083.1 CYTH domain-containing protein [Halomonas saccharevitans]
MANEIELKLALGALDTEDAGGAEALRRHPRLAGVTPALTQLGNTYFDTPEGDLEAARMALRLRRADGRLLQTLKTRGQGGGGLSTRGEWEWEVPGPGLDLEGLAALPPMTEREAGLLERLAPRFATDFERETWWLEHEGATIELALDIGEIRAGERAVAIRELELELKAGEPEALWSLAEALTDRVALRPSDTSKAARGGALLDGARSLPEACDAGGWLHRATAALDALADTGDDAWRLEARRAFQRLAELGDDAKGDNGTGEASGRDQARALAEALDAERWLTPAFGRHMLRLARRLPGDAELS